MSYLTHFPDHRARVVGPAHEIAEGDEIVHNGSYVTVLVAEVSCDEPKVTFSLANGAELTYPLEQRIKARSTNVRLGSF